MISPPLCTPKHPEQTTDMTLSALTLEATYVTYLPTFRLRIFARDVMLSVAAHAIVLGASFLFLAHSNITSSTRDTIMPSPLFHLTLTHTPQAHGIVAAVKVGTIENTSKSPQISTSTTSTPPRFNKATPAISAHITPPLPATLTATAVLAALTTAEPLTTTSINMMSTPSAASIVASDTHLVPMPIVQSAPATKTTTATINDSSSILVEPISHGAYLSNPAPNYPSLSRKLGEQGTVKWKVLIGTDGLTKQLILHQSSGFPRLDEAAKEALLKWHYIPGKRGDKPEAMWHIVPIEFGQQS
jgi:periplasmic protein TonB